MAFLSIAKILLSLGMIWFGSRIFYYSPRIKHLKLTSSAYESRIIDAKKLAERGRVDVLEDEMKKQANIRDVLYTSEGKNKFFSDALAACSIILAAVEIILTIPSFSK